MLSSAGFSKSKQLEDEFNRQQKVTIKFASALLNKTIVKHRRAEVFENLRMQAFVKDMGIQIKQGVATKVRRTVKCRSLEDFKNVHELICNHSNDNKSI